MLHKAITEEVHSKRKVATETEQIRVAKQEHALQIALFDRVPFEIYGHEEEVEVSFVETYKLMFPAAGAGREVDYKLNKLPDVGWCWVAGHGHRGGFAIHSEGS